MVFDATTDPDQQLSIRVWDLRTLQFLPPLRSAGLARHQDGFAIEGKATFSRDGTFLAAAARRGSDRVICVWDVELGIELAALSLVQDFDWAPESPTLITIGPSFIGKAPADSDARDGLDEGSSYQHGWISCWEVARPTPSYWLGTAVRSLCLNEDGSRLAANARLYQVTRGKQGQELMPLVDYGSDDAHPQFVGNDQLWATRTSRLERFAPQRREVTLPELDYPEREKEARQRASKDLEEHKKQEYYKDIIFTAQPKRVVTERCAYSPDGRRLLRSGRINFDYSYTHTDGAGTISFSTQIPGLELWNHEEGKRLAVWGGANESWSCFQFSPDGRRVATSNSTANVWSGQRPGERKIWDLATGKEERVLSLPVVSGLVFSRDARRLLAVDPHHSATLLDVESGRELFTWKVKQGTWQGYALSSDGTLVASGGKDRTIRLWDAVTGRELAHWQGHDGGVSALLFSKDDTILYSGSQDCTVKLWNLPLIRKGLADLGLDWK
jgi:WD40 repeat protein